MKLAIVLLSVVLVGCSVEGTRKGPDGEAIPFEVSVGEYVEDTSTNIVFEVLADPANSSIECTCGYVGTSQHRWTSDEWNGCGVSFYLVGISFGPYCPYHLLEWMERNIPKSYEAEEE